MVSGSYNNVQSINNIGFDLFDGLKTCLLMYMCEECGLIIFVFDGIILLI